MAENKPLAVYVHWPWCKAKCPYCDFNAHVAESIPREDYLAAIRAHVAETQDFTGPRSVNAIFFGGGTPSLMGADLAGKVLAEISHAYTVQSDAEITLECNPTSSSRELFLGLKSAGFNRVSIGVQSTRPEWLDFLGRKHNVQEALETLDSALETMGNVNADLIFGLPQQDLQMWLQQLKSLASAGLPHMSCYQLTIEPQTAFFSAVKRGEWEPLDGDRQADFIAETRHILRDAGYQNYEISNFAKPGKACRHNVHVWGYGDYAGIGPGAHGRISANNGQGLTHWATQATKHPRNWLARWRDRRPMTDMTPLTPAMRWREALLAGLRLEGGFDVMTMESSLGGKLTQNVDGEALAVLRQFGMVSLDGGRLMLTEKGWPLLDGILAQLLT